MQNDQQQGRLQLQTSLPPRPESSNPSVTSAIGLGETVGRLRARRSSLFTHTVVWVTGLICLAFLLGSLVQAWSNSQLIQRVQAQQARLQQAQEQYQTLFQEANYYNEPFVLESEARQRLEYIRPGEHLVIVIATTDAGQQTPPSSSNTQGPPNFWQEWWNIFFGN